MINYAGVVLKTRNIKIPIFAFMIICSSAVHAESTNKSGRIIEEVVVTATKREANLRDIPASISAISGNSLEEMGAQNMEDIVKLVPGVNITEPSNNAMRITIRGVAAQPSTNSTTGILYGNVSFSDAYVPRISPDPNPFDLESVEVLKGPQGTLYGASALNGAIRYVPTPPDFSEHMVKYFYQYTNVAHGGGAPVYGVAVNTPLSSNEVSAFRITAFNRTSPGWLDNNQLHVDDTNEITQKGIRAMLGWAPNEKWELKLMSVTQETDSEDIPVADNEEGRLEGDYLQRNPAKKAYSLGAISIGYESNLFRVVAESSYLEKELDALLDSSNLIPLNTGFPTFTRSDQAFSETWSHELRFTSNDDTHSKWKWTAGLFAWKQDVEFGLDVYGSQDLFSILNVDFLDGFLINDGRLSLVELLANSRIKERAIFFDVTRSIGASWELGIGGRYYQTESKGNTFQSGLLLAVENQKPEHTISADVEESGFNPKVSVLWYAKDNISTFVSAARGFRVGGVQAGFAPPSPENPEGKIPHEFKSDSIQSYELGVRTEWFENTLQFDVTTYFLKWEDAQVFQQDPSGLGAYIDNAGEVESKGAELSLLYLMPFSELSLTFTAAYTETITKTDFVGSDSQNVPPGADWPFSPRWQTAASLSDHYSFWNIDVRPTLTHTYIGTAKDSLTTTISDEVFGITQWDFQLSIEALSISWLPKITFIGNNLTDTRGVTHKSVTDSYTEVTYIRPRAYTLRISGSF